MTARNAPSRAVFDVLRSVTTTGNLEDAIARLRVTVNANYAGHGVGSVQYEQSFDDLHYLNMANMRANFLASRGMPPDGKTPYDEPELLGLGLGQLTH